MSPFVLSGVVIGACVFILWLISLKLKDASIADIWWGPGFAVIAWVAGAAHGSQTERLLWVQVLLTAWGLRLGIHLARRNLGKGEDRRYQAMRAKSDAFWLISLFQVFVLQGSIQLVVSAPVFGVLGATTPLGLLDYVGLGMVVAGIAIEAIADIQLARFLSDSDHSGRVMDRGLWGLSRHPNYFGNAVLWCGMGAVGLGAGASPWTLVGPLLMVFLLLKVSGVAMLEETITERRPEYRQYMERVSAFVPLPPRKRI